MTKCFVKSDENGGGVILHGDRMPESGGWVELEIDPEALPTPESTDFETRRVDPVTRRMVADSRLVTAKQARVTAEKAMQISMPVEQLEAETLGTGEK